MGIVVQSEKQGSVMPSFGVTSRKRLDTCHKDLQTIMDAVVEHYDIAIICGHRGEREQREAYQNHRSQLNWPRSKHNEYPSRAVDIAPYPIDWEDNTAFAMMAGRVLCTADRLYREGKVSHKLKSGLDWNNDHRTRDHGFLDAPHFELY